MVPLNVKCLYCLQHLLFEHPFDLFYMCLERAK